MPGYDVRVGVSNQARQQRKVIVLSENRGGPATDFVQDLSGEPLVYRPVGLPIAQLEHRLGVGIVTQRPQSGVGKAVIISCFFFLRKPH